MLMDMLIDIPGYEILEEVGRGGMSTVYRAIQNSLDRELALKVMSPGLSLDPHFKERFRREGQIVAQLSHPNIIAVYDMGVAGDRLFITMEYVAGKTLKERIRTCLTLEESIEIVKAVAHALKYAHQRGYIHRDIKPSNILFREDGSPVLADFGIARAIQGNDSLTQTGMSFGTPRYMSPEQIRGERLDARSDLYSLGMVFYQMLAGQWPYEAQSAFSVSLKHLFEPIPQLPEHLRALQPVLDGMLAKVAEQRFQDEDAFLSALDDALATNTEPADTTFSPRPNRPATQARGRGLGNTLSPIGIKPWVVGWGVTAALVGIATFLLFRELPPDPESSAPQAEVERPRQEPQTVERHVANLLDQASTAMARSNLVTPARHNAYNLYRQVLAIEPDNQQAHAGLQRIVDRLTELAREKQAAGELTESLALSNQGLSIAPEHAVLQSLSAQLEHSLAERQQTESQADRSPKAQSRFATLEPQTEKSGRAQKQAEQITTLLARAKKQLSDLKLTTPEKDNAFETFSQVLATNPGNQAALNGLRQIADRYEHLARRQIESNKLSDALALVKRGLEVHASHANLSTLKKEIARALEMQKSRKAEVDSLLAKAEQQLKAGKRTGPVGDNAFETLRHVLELDAHNRQARRVLQGIARHFEESARDVQESGDLRDGLSLAQEGLRLFPEDDGLRSLIKELTRLNGTVSSLLGRAKQQIRSGQLTTPRGDNALETINKALDLDPKNELAKTSLQAIPKYCAAFARARRQAGQVQKGLSIVEEGLRFFPENKQLLALRQELHEQSQEQAQPQPEGRKRRVFGTF